jgi:hypothetical protein
VCGSEADEVELGRRMKEVAREDPVSFFLEIFLRQALSCAPEDSGGLGPRSQESFRRDREQGTEQDLGELSDSKWT